MTAGYVEKVLGNICWIYTTMFRIIHYYVQKKEKRRKYIDPWPWWDRVISGQASGS